jgi:hypothetical protein
VIRNADGSIGFSPILLPGVLGFVGWLPYFNKVWPEAQDKLQFKQTAQARGLRIPEWETTSGKQGWPFLVKDRRSTLGRGLRGPYLADDDVEFGEGSFVEGFQFGQLVKAWFWAGELIVVEIAPMPYVVGDGQHTLADLVLQQTGRSAEQLDALKEIARLQGLTPGAVPAAKRVVTVDYRYLSELNIAAVEDRNAREAIRNTDIERQLSEAGVRMHASIPLGLREEVLFTLDAVLDGRKQLWFLEMNCNPQLHPAAYAQMFDRLFKG